MQSPPTLAATGLLVVATTTWAALLALDARGAEPAAPRIRLHGVARLEAHATKATPDTGLGRTRVVLAGTLHDEVGKSLGHARVAVSVTSDTGGAALVAAAACDDRALVPIVLAADRLLLPTDDTGAFCLRVSPTGEHVVAHLETMAGELVDAARADVSLDVARAAITLRFDPEPGNVDLDGARATFDVLATRDDDGATAPAAGLGLALTNEAGLVLGAATTSPTGRARFTLDPTRTGPAGQGSLKVTYAGGADSAPASRTAPVLRRTAVELVAPDAKEGTLAAACAEEGAPIHVQATAPCARAGCTARVTGTVEAFVGGEPVGAAPIDARGEAELVATFSTPGRELADVRVRYVPDAPWLLPRSELELVMPLRPPSPWRRLPLLGAALLALGWLALGRIPARRRARTFTGALAGARPVEASIEVVREGGPEEGWTGRMLDAHDGGGVAGGRVAIERRGFRAVEVVAEVTSGAQGEFSLPHVDTHAGDELVAEAPLHAAHRLPLPRPGELRVALVTRRRALLDRLVAWARRRGQPFDARPEASPAHVRRAAGGELSIARWADEVERAAFGGRVVDAAAERDVDRLAPEHRVVDDPRRPSL